jgi:serine/threonine-protein kinase RsbW
MSFQGETRDMASISAEHVDAAAIEEDGTVALTFPARPEFIALARLALTGLARTRGLSQELVADLKLALTEACSNSVRHAYDAGRLGTVAIQYGLSSDRMIIEVADEGSGFDPKTLERAQEELDEGGLGIAIIRAVTDDLEIGARPEGGSRLRFTKFLP